MSDASSRLSRFLGIVFTSDSDGEIVVAARQARKLLKAAGLGWHDVAEALAQRGKLLEAAQTLKADRDRLAGEVERLKRSQQANGTSNTFAAQLWQTAGMPISVDSRHARWLRDLDSQGRIYLTTKESGFVDSCTRCRRLSEPMRNWLDDLVRQAIARTGEAPPP